MYDSDPGLKKFASDENLKERNELNKDVTNLVNSLMRVPGIPRRRSK